MLVELSWASLVTSRVTRRARIPTVKLFKSILINKIMNADSMENDAGSKHKNSRPLCVLVGSCDVRIKVRHALQLTRPTTSDIQWVGLGICNVYVDTCELS